MVPFGCVCLKCTFKWHLSCRPYPSDKPQARVEEQELRSSLLVGKPRETQTATVAHFEASGETLNRFFLLQSRDPTHLFSSTISAPTSKHTLTAAGSSRPLALALIAQAARHKGLHAEIVKNSSLYIGQTYRAWPEGHAVSSSASGRETGLTDSGGWGTWHLAGSALLARVGRKEIIARELPPWADPAVMQRTLSRVSEQAGCVAAIVQTFMKSSCPLGCTS